MPTRPVRRNIVESIQAWDADVDRNFEILTDSPLPLATQADVGTLTSTYPPDEYEDCITLVNGVLYTSNGVVWSPVIVADPVATSTASTVGEIVTDFNNLLVALRAAGVVTAPVI